MSNFVSPFSFVSSYNFSLQEFFLLIISLLVACLLKLQLFSTNRKLFLPPGPIRWPILGSIPQMLKYDLTYGHLQLLALAKKYGPIVSFGFGVHFAVVISSIDILKEVMRQQSDATLERFRFEFIDQRTDYRNLGLIWSYGEAWKQQRKLVVKLLRQFGFGKKQTMFETIQAEVNDLVADIQKEVVNSDGIWEVNVNRLSASTVNIVWASVGGYRFDPHSPKIQRQLELNHEMFEAFGHKNLLGMFPFLKFFKKLSGFQRHVDIQEQCQEFARELINDSKIKRNGRAEAESVIEAYLDEIEINKSNPNATIIDAQLVVILMDLFLAGADTISSLLNWILLYLALYPEVQNKARIEIEKFTSEDPMNTVEIMRFPYAQALIWEVMRHAPFYTLNLQRCVGQDIECAGYKIPAGTCLFVNYYAMLHDESVWGDPEVFRPERLLLPSGKLNSTMVVQIPEFGMGVRKCLGETVAMPSVLQLTTGLIRNFSFEVIVGREPKLEPGNPALNMKPKPFVVKIISLKQEIPLTENLVEGITRETGSRF